MEFIKGVIYFYNGGKYAPLTGGAPNAVLYVEQTLTSGQQNQGRENLGVNALIQGVAELAEGKSAAYVVDDTVDTVFDSQNLTITLTSSFTDINLGTITLDKLKIGDVIYVTETDVPDRWVQTITKSADEVVSVTLGEMETAKVPVLDVQVDGVSVVNNGIANIQNIDTGVLVEVADNGAVSQTLDPNKFYDFTGTLTSLTISFGTAVSGRVNEYKGQFLTGFTAPTVTFPASVNWIGGSFPSLDADSTYQFSVLNNIGVIVGVANPAVV